MSFDALKNSPVPILYFMGYRLVKSRSNSKNEIIIYLAKPENAVKYRREKRIRELYKQRVHELKENAWEVQHVTYKKRSCWTRLWRVVKRILFCRC